MKNGTKVLALATMIILVGSVASAQYGGGVATGQHRGGMQLGFLPSGDVTPEEAATMLWMREEEKLARDVYLAMFAAWQSPVFANIAASEQVHMDSVKALLDRYELADPVTDATPGVFTEPQLADLYLDLVAQGDLSLVDALTVGATVEDMDLADLATAVAATDNVDIAVVYEHLARGSRNHLRAFVAELTALGASYSPAYISEELFAQIISTPMEQGNGFGYGPGAGSGSGDGSGGNGDGTCGGSGSGGGHGSGGKN